MKNQRFKMSEVAANQFMMLASGKVKIINSILQLLSKADDDLLDIILINEHGNRWVYRQIYGKENVRLVFIRDEDGLFLQEIKV